MTGVIIDTDVSVGVSADIDDGFALAYALSSPEYDIRLISTVSGNADAEISSALTRYLIHDFSLRTGRDLSAIDVVTGAHASLTPGLRAARPELDAPEWLRPYATPRTPFAAARIAELVLAHPGELTIVALGPLTNIALAVSLHRDVAPSIGSLIVMGGSFLDPSVELETPGEWNFYCDPHAVQVVLDSGVIPTFVGLDVTSHVHLTETEARAMSRQDEPVVAFLGDAALRWMKVDQTSPIESDRHCCLHDALAMVAVGHPDVITSRLGRVRVDAEPEHQGRSSFEAVERPSDANARVAVAVDVARFRDEFWSSAFPEIRGEGA